MENLKSIFISASNFSLALFDSNRLLLATTLFLTISLNSSAQNWCPQGARWLYEEFHMIGKYFRKYEYTHDTVIADKQVKGIETTRIQLLFSALDPANGDFTQVYSGIHITKLDTLYLYESNDSVFVYIHPEFKLMYQFNPTIDQQFEVGNYAAQ